MSQEVKAQETEPVYSKEFEDFVQTFREKLPGNCISKEDLYRIWEDSNEYVEISGFKEMCGIGGCCSPSRVWKP